MNRARLVIQIVVLLIVLAALGVGASLLSQANAQPKYKSVTFRVESGGGSADITWKIDGKTMLSEKQVKTPWEKTMRVENGVQVILTAANPNSYGGVSCKILLKRSAWKSSSIDQPNRGIACGGIVP